MLANGKYLFCGFIKNTVTAEKLNANNGFVGKTAAEMKPRSYFEPINFAQKGVKNVSQNYILA